MTCLENQIKKLTTSITKEMEMQKAIIKFMSSLDINIRCSAINNEFLYNIAELEFMFKVRAGKKEEFLSILSLTQHAKTINGTTYYPLFAILELINIMKKTICLTHYWQEEDTNA